MTQQNHHLESGQYEQLKSHKIAFVLQSIYKTTRSVSFEKGKTINTTLILMIQKHENQVITAIWREKGRRMTIHLATNCWH
jgi:hypothetical protein